MRSPGPDEHGKIQKALWITTHYTEAIEADLQRYYGLDLLDLFRPDSGLTWGKFLALVDNLPPESALSTAVRNDTPDDVLAERVGDPEKSAWSTVESLLAALIDEVRNLSWAYASAHSERKIPRPAPVTRPGVSDKRRQLKKISIENIQALDPRLRGLSPEEAEARFREMTGRG